MKQKFRLFYAFDMHFEAEQVIEPLGTSGFEAKKPSQAGKSVCSDKRSSWVTRKSWLRD